jgi:hypothetical protein
LVENVKQYNGWYLQDGDLIPAEDQDDHEPARFLKKRHFFTQAGVIISLMRNMLMSWCESMLAAPETQNNSRCQWRDLCAGGVG